MSTTFKAAVDCYLRAKTLSRGTRNEYFCTLRKWEAWGEGPPIEELQAHPRIPGLGPRARRCPRWHEPRSHGEQGPAAPARRPLLGVGARADRRAAAIP